jgi:phosphatidylglycerophosphate synthase
VIDSPLDRAFHRRLSRPISRAAVRHRITPNQVSVASLAVGIAAAWSFWNATPAWALVGLVLYALSVVLDHADGEVARLTLAESRLGEWLDVAVDTIVHVLVAVAMGVTTAHVAGGRGLWLGILAGLGFIASAFVAKTSARPAADDRLGRVLMNLGARDGFYAMLLVFIAARVWWPAALPALMIVVGLGSQAYWLVRAAHRLASRA